MSATTVIYQSVTAILHTPAKTSAPHSQWTVFQYLPKKQKSSARLPLGLSPAG